MDISDFTSVGYLRVSFFDYFYITWSFSEPFCFGFRCDVYEPKWEVQLALKLGFDFFTQQAWDKVIIIAKNVNESKVWLL